MAETAAVICALYAEAEREAGALPRTAEYALAEWLYENDDPRGEAWMWLLNNHLKPVRVVVMDSMPPPSTVVYRWFHDASIANHPHRLEAETVFGLVPPHALLPARVYHATRPQVKTGHPTFMDCMLAAAAGYIRATVDPAYAEDGWADLEDWD